MAKQTREVYMTGNPQLDNLFNRIAQRLDYIEGLKPDLDDGIYELEDGKIITTTEVALTVEKGGTGLDEITDHSLIVGSGTDPVTELGVATNGQIPIGSSGKDPVLAVITGTANEINITNGAGTITIGIVDPLIVSKGGTGLATLTNHGILLGSGTDPVTPLAAASNGQLPIGSTGADPVLATLTEGNGIGITNSAGGIEVAVNSYLGQATALKELTFSNDTGTLTLFTVTGDVIVQIVPVITTDLVPNTSANARLGVVGNTDAMIVDSDVDDLDARGIWVDQTPDNEIEPLDRIRDYIITDGNNIVLTLDAQVNTGAITFYLFWSALSADGNVVAA